jgi:sugar lactone lactonase YvrE
MFHADTAARTITRRNYGDVIGSPEVFAEIDGMPDGIAVDADGRVWVTVFDQGRVDVYSPSGELLPEHTIVLPDAHIASVAFAGPRRDVVVLATGMPVMRHWLRRRRGNDGFLFVAPSSLIGQPATEWIPVELPQRLER